MIAGFPGETDEDFAATFDFIERLPFTYLHVFSFSARPGTEAAELALEQIAVAPVTIRERARTCARSASRKSAAFRACASPAARFARSPSRAAATLGPKL